MATTKNLPTLLLGTDELDESTLRDELDAFIKQGLSSVAGNERRSTDGVEYVRWIERDERHARLCGTIWELASRPRAESALRTFWLNVTRASPDGQIHWTLYYGVDPEVTGARFARDAADLLTSPSDVSWLAVVSGSSAGSEDGRWK